MIIITKTGLSYSIDKQVLWKLGDKMKIKARIKSKKNKKIASSSKIDNETSIQKYKPFYGNFEPVNCQKMKLSVREIECLKWSAMGLTSKQIAKTITLSVFTVRTHLKKLKQKLSCQTIAHAVSEGIKRGYI